MRVLLAGCRVRPFMENGKNHDHNVVAIDGFADYDATLFGEVLPMGSSVLQRLSKGQEAAILFAPAENDLQLYEEHHGTGRLMNTTPEAVAICRDRSFMEFLCSGIDRVSAVKQLSPAAGLHGKAVAKCRYSSGGTGVEVWHGKPLLEGWELLEFINGTSFSATYISAGGRCKILGLCEHILGEAEFKQSGFMYGGLIHPAELPATVWQAAEKVGTLATWHSKLTGFWGADFIWNGEDVHLLEINPRITAGLELVANRSKLDIISLQQQAVVGEQLPNLPVNAIPLPSLGTAVLYSGNALTFSQPERWFAAGFRDVPHHGTRFGAGEPVISAYASGADLADVLHNLKAAAAEFYLAIGP